MAGPREYLKPQANIPITFTPTNIYHNTDPEKNKYGPTLALVDARNRVLTLKATNWPLLVDAGIASGDGPDSLRPTGDTMTFIKQEKGSPKIENVSTAKPAKRQEASLTEMFKESIAEPVNPAANNWGELVRTMDTLVGLVADYKNLSEESRVKIALTMFIEARKSRVSPPIPEAEIAEAKRQEALKTVAANPLPEEEDDLPFN